MVLISSPDPGHRWNLEVWGEARDLWLSQFSDTKTLRIKLAWARSPTVAELGQGPWCPSPSRLWSSYPERPSRGWNTCTPLPANKEKQRGPGELISLPAFTSILGPWVIFAIWTNHSFPIAPFTYISWSLRSLSPHCISRKGEREGACGGIFPPKLGASHFTLFPSAGKTQIQSILWTEQGHITRHQWRSPLASFSTLLETPGDSKGVEIKDSKNLNSSLHSAL